MRVAAWLPAMPRSGSRDARRLAVVALAAWGLAGCAGLRRTPVAIPDVEPEPVAIVEPAPAPDPAAGARARAEANAREEARERQRQLPHRVHAQVAKRMPRHAPAVHRRVAGAVLAESDRAGLDPLLVLAVIHVESSFEPKAESRAGAVGLMQVRRPTLREELGRSRIRFSDAFDPLTNVQAGVRYLRRMLDRFGELDLALMAYNAGPGRLRELLDRGRIPARIQAYPRKVAREVDRLRAALGTSPPAAGTVVATK
jgi:soluble lytic murein transglycosylase-like protein